MRRKVSGMLERMEPQYDEEGSRIAAIKSSYPIAGSLVPLRTRAERRRDRSLYHFFCKPGSGMKPGDRLTIQGKRYTVLAVQEYPRHAQARLAEEESA